MVFLPKNSVGLYGTGFAVKEQTGRVCFGSNFTATATVHPGNQLFLSKNKTDSA